MKQAFLTPVGRLVQGDPFEAQTKNMQGQPLMTMSGQPTQRYFIAVAFRKDDQAFGQFWQLLEQVGRASFPQLGQIPPPWDPRCRFSWKVMDGDGVDDNGKPNSNKEGFAGHWVVKFSSSFAPRIFHAGHYQPHEQIQDPKTVKRGYFVRVSGSMEGNGNAQKPGVYVNLDMVEFAGIGPEIVSGPDAASVFGAQAGVLPQGAQPLPMHAGAVGGAAGLPGMAPTQGLPQMQPAAQMAVAQGLPQLQVSPGAAAALQSVGMGNLALAQGMPQQVAVQPHAGILGNVAPGVGANSLPGMNNGGASAAYAIPSPSSLPNAQPQVALQGAAVGQVAQGLPSLGGLPALGATLTPMQPQMTALGMQSGFTYQQLRSQYTDEQLRAGGYIA